MCSHILSAHGSNYCLIVMAVGTENILVNTQIAAAQAGNMIFLFCRDMSVATHVTAEALIAFTGKFSMADSLKLGLVWCSYAVYLRQSTSVTAFAANRPSRPGVLAGLIVAGGTSCAYLNSSIHVC